ncbi:immunoglobulin-like domain-containing protein [Clostridioides sp. ES-W-0016-02]|uniref:immunoglobulin-like domain-containing protein n=1 Tax=Clostridioides sp. ES-W-0016-02 TaxID=2770788 RepID=UPI001D122CE2
MDNKKLISIVLSASILSTNVPYNVFADNIKRDAIVYNENNSINKKAQNEGKEKSSESFSLDMGNYVDTNGILTFPEAKGTIDNPTYLRFDFNRNVYENVTITYSLNSEEKTLIGKNIKIPVKTQNELNEVLRTLKIDTKNNKKLGFDIILGGLPLYKSIEGVPSRLYKAERAIDGNSDSFYGAINKNNSVFTILFEDKTYIESVLIKANKNFVIKGLKNGSWTKIGEGTPSFGKDESKKIVNVTAGEYEGIRIEQAHSGVDSCTISELEFNKESDREKINYNRSEYSLNLGKKSINNDGSISFTEASAKGDNVKLLINFKNSSNKNKISYIQNGKYNEKEGDSGITVSNESELNEIIRSLKIYNDNKVENNVRITLLPDTFSFTEDVPEGVLAQGNSLADKYTAENVFSGSNGYFISGSDNQLILKNTKELYINGAYFLNGNSIIIVKGLKNGTWTDIGKHSSNEAEMINLAPGYYDEIKFVSSSTLDMRNLYLRYSNISKDFKLEIFKDESPELKVGANIDILQNNKFDIMKGVTATDVIDGDLTDKITVEIMNPNGESVSELDTNILGKWTIKYSVKDSGDNTTSYLRTLRVVKDFNVSIDLGKELVTSKYVKFPNVKISSTDEKQKIDGLKMYFPQNFNKDTFKVHYILNGVEKVSTDQVIEINNEFSINEAEELIKSIKIEHKNNEEFKFTVRLGKNEVDDMVYNYENNHYYKFISASGITWKEAKVDAEKQEFLGVRGYLATITSANEQEVVHNLTSNCVWLGGTDEEAEGNWKWVTGEPFEYTNWYPGRPDNYLNQQHYIISYNDNQRLWDDDFNIASGGKIDGYIVEFGLDEKLPYPNTLDKFKYEDTATIEPLKAKQDIVLNALVDKDNNKVILDWNNIKDIDYYKIWQKKEGQNDFQTMSSNNFAKGEKVKVLNIYPTVSVKNTFKNWVNESGQGLIDIDVVSNADFNNNPDYYLKNESGNYKYDVIACGFANINSSIALPEKSVIAINEAKRNNVGILLGHHYIGENIGNFPKYNEEYYMNKYKNTSEVCSNEVEIDKSHEALNYPNQLGKVGDVLEIPNSHSNYSAFPFEEDVIIKFHNPKKHVYPYNCNKDYNGFTGEINGKNVSQNAYLSIHGNTAQIQTGHSGKSITNDEKNMLANTVFYLAQKIDESYLEDVNGKDINSPTVPKYQLYDTGIKQGIQFNSEDRGSTYEYYVEGVSKYGDVTNISNKKKVEIKSGFKGYSYEVSNNPTPSVSLGDVINSTDGFIPANELASKLYVHIISLDKVGNKSEVVTLPISGIFEDLPPVLDVGGNISISRGKDYNLMENITATDDYDGDLTKDISITIKDPSNKIVDQFDTNVLGKWSIEYSVKDSKQQESKAIKEITVKENLDYLSINLGEPNKKRFVVSFPNATVVNNSNELISGIKLYISEGYNDSILIKYKDKGVQKTTKGQQIILTGNYSREEAEELIKSIQIEHDNSTSFIFNVRLQNNSVDDIIYNPVNGNYYQFVADRRISWKNAKLKAEKMEYKGLKGHLATIKSKHELNLFNSLTTKTVWLGATDEEKEGQWKWVTGEFVKFTNWCAGEPNNFGGTEDYMVSIKNSNGLWNDTNNAPDPYWTDIEGFVVEYENVDNNNGSSYEVCKYEDSVKVDNIIANQDIVLNLDKKDNIVLNWNKYKDAEYYKILRKEENSFEIIKDNLKESLFSDSLAEDKVSPKMEYSLILNKERTAKMEFHSEDLGSEYEYNVESYDEDNYQTAYSNTVKTKITSGFKGYRYLVDESPNTEISGEVNNTDGKFEFKNVTDNTYLHIYAIDNNGNKTETKHIKLSDDTYNNKPRITLPGKNRVISIGEEFDKLQGVSAYDFEDGDLTNKIKVEGEVNNNKKGVYKIKYTVEDSKGIQVEEIVQVHVTGDMEVNIEEGSNNLEVNWTKVNNAVKYVLYRTNENGFSFEEKGTFNDTQFIDNTATDISSPVITYLGEINEDSIKTRKVVSLSKEILRKLNKEIDNTDKIKLKVMSKDLGTTYRYFVEALDKDNNVINSSEIRNGKVTAGLAGFSYIIDEKENTEVKNSVNIKNAEDIDIKNNKSKFLHIKAIDKNGNVSKTIHHLITGKYDTNYAPVIKGLTSKRVKEGESFNPLAGVTAYDVEDGDITNKIQVIGSVNTSKNGKYKLTYKVEDRSGNIREVKRNILVHGDMEIEVTANKEDNNVVVSWDKNVLGEDVFYEVRKWNSVLDNYSTIGYTEDLSFVDNNTKDIYGPEVNGVTEDKEEQQPTEEEDSITENQEAEEENSVSEEQDYNPVEEKDIESIDGIEENNINSDVSLRKESNIDDHMKLNINARDRGVSQTYQVRTRLKKDNTIVRDMTDEEGRDWDVGVEFSGEIEYYRWKLSNKREDNLETGIVKTSVSSNEIEFNPEDYKYIHFIPYDTFGNAGQLVHYELGEFGNEESPIGPPVIEGVKDSVIMVDSKFDVLQGIKAHDFKGEDLTNYIKVNGFVNVNRVGEYTITYSVMDFKGQLTEETAIIRVADFNENIPDKKPDKIDNAPVVNMLNEEVYIKVGSKYNVMDGIKVTDIEDGDLTSKVTYTTNLDTSKVGDYIVSYYVRDSRDNRVRWNRVVHVVDYEIEEDSDSNDPSNTEGNGAFPQIYAYPAYIAVGTEFNPYSDVRAYDEEDGYITNKLKVSGYVNTLKPGIYYLTYKVTDSNGNTSYCGRGVYVYEGGWDNGAGEKPDPNPDWGENDNEEEEGDHIPSKPNQPNQDEDEDNSSNLPDIDDNQDGDGQNDIYIDKNGNVIKPDGSIVTPDGTVIKPDGETPSIDEEGNIIIPPNVIVIKPDGSSDKFINGAIIRPDGTIVVNDDYSGKEPDNKNPNDDDDNNNYNNDDNNYNNEEKTNTDSLDSNGKSPSTGDKGILSSVALGLLAIGGLFFNRKKK